MKFSTFSNTEKLIFKVITKNTYFFATSGETARGTCSYSKTPFGMRPNKFNLAGATTSNS